MPSQTKSHPQTLHTVIESCAKKKEVGWLELTYLTPPLLLPLVHLANEGYPSPPWVSHTFLELAFKATWKSHLLSPVNLFCPTPKMCAGGREVSCALRGTLSPIALLERQSPLRLLRWSEWWLSGGGGFLAPSLSPPPSLPSPAGGKGRCVRSGVGMGRGRWAMRPRREKGRASSLPGNSASEAPKQRKGSPSATKRRSAHA